MKFGNYMGKEVIFFFLVEMLKGINDVLVNLNFIIFLEFIVKIIFGEEGVMGKFMKINNEMEVMVIGVYSDFFKSFSFYGLVFIVFWEFFVFLEEWVRNVCEMNNWDINVF